MNGEDKKNFEFYPIEENSGNRVNVYDSGAIHAGFPTPVQDAYMDQPIDLNKVLVKHPATTFITRVTGDSMIGEGVDDGDLLIVDRSLYPTEENLTVCVIDGDFALKRIYQSNCKVLLLSGNSKYKPIEVIPSMDFRVWGVVIWVLKKKVNI
jgi:DNA polymerase V